jgi:hypothetical protein
MDAMQTAWAAKEFGGARLGDGRQVRNVIKIAAALAHRPELSFSAACGSATRQAAHRIFEHPGTQLEGLLRPHVQQTACRCQEHARVLVAQDTTAFVFPQEQTTGLTALNRREHTVGLLGHGALAMTTSGTPLGLLHLDIWGVDESRLPLKPGEKVPLEERESYKWVEGLQGVHTALPAQTEAIVMQDREGDIFALLAEERPAHVHLLTRVAQNRVIRYRDPGAAASRSGKLKAVLASAPVVGTRLVSVPRRSARAHQVAVPERVAELTLRVLAVEIQPPVGFAAEATPQPVWLILAQEEDPDPGVKPVSWVLMSTLPVPEGAVADQMVGYYARRWVIERLHMVLKSGLRTERLQIDDAISLRHALVIYYVVAWRLMQLTLLAREQPEGPATLVVDEEEVEVLTAAVGQAVRTLRQVVAAIAKLGGFMPYQKTPPGLKVLWLGWQHFQGMVIGYRLAKTGRPLWPVGEL